MESRFYGYMRNAFSAAANVLTAIGFALILASLFAIRDGGRTSGSNRESLKGDFRIVTAGGDNTPASSALRFPSERGYHCRAARDCRGLCWCLAHGREWSEMKRFMVMSVGGALLASNVLTSAADARSQVVDNGDRSGSGGGHISVGGFTDRRGSGHRYLHNYYFGASQPGYYIRYNPHCHFPEEWPKLPPWPPFCN
jgi:hypothetical protein